MLFVGRESREGGGFAGGRSLPNRSTRVLEKKFSEIFGTLGICLAGMRPRCSGSRLLRCDKPGTLKRLLRQTSLPVSHQYGLQIVDGMVTFSENYEGELEKYWTKTLSFQL
jgi:hypothetical protein